MNPAPVAGILVAFAALAFFNAQLISARVMAYVAPADLSNASQELHTSNMVDPAETRLSIPKISVDAPVVYGMGKVEDYYVQKALEDGVLHFGGSPTPGQPGNSVFVGHSSNQPWAPGDYKFVFMMLDKLEVGDKIFLTYKGTRYTYDVTEKKVVKPNDVSVLEGSKTPTATFITCTPLGTNTNRLVIKAKLSDPVFANEDMEGLKRSAPELNAALPGQGYSTVESLTQQ
ncbi:MAG TPA: class D sortase [Candidatus Saccharimonadales bacterium]|nr:class D sortase [Candidatus Saccharimonadales bacterium]